MQIRTVYLSFLLTLCFVCSSKAQDYNNALGIRLGTNVSLSYKQFLTENRAIEAIGGITRTGGQSLLTLGLFYDIHRNVTADISSLRWYYGIGAFVAKGNSDIATSLALAGNIGLEYTLEGAPINIFIDAIPYLDLINGRNFDVEASLGARYIFGR